MDSNNNISEEYDNGKSPEAEDTTPFDTPSSFQIPKHVVVVMDGLKEFSMEPLEWVLKSVDIESYYIVTLLGLKPWLNIPLFSKTRTDIWTSDLDFTEDNQPKIQTLKEICHRYGVKLQMRSVMGYPLKRLVAEQIVGLHATLVVFDRHQQKYKEYYREKIPCNMAMMNDEGGVQVIKGTFLFGSVDNTTPAQSPSQEDL